MGPLQSVTIYSPFHGLNRRSPPHRPHRRVPLAAGNCPLPRRRRSCLSRRHPRLRSPPSLSCLRQGLQDGYAMVAPDGPGVYQVITESGVGNDGVGITVTPGTVVAYVTTELELVNHGITETLKDNLLKASQQFFDLPMEEKAKYPDRFAETHIMDPIRYGTSFNLKADEVKYWRDFLKLIVHPEFHCPPNPPEFGELMREFTQAIRLVGRKMLSGVWESLGVDEKYMTEALKLDSTFQIVICNLYPKCPQPDLAFGLPPHSDHGLLGILYQNDIDGLELIHNGKWVRVKAEPNSFLINTGDHLEIATNGRYTSIVHRVVTNQAQTRMTIVTTACPGEDAVVLPAPELVTDESPAKFRGMTYRDYIECQQNNRLQDKSILDSLRIN